MAPLPRVPSWQAHPVLSRPALERFGFEFRSVVHVQRLGQARGRPTQLELPVTQPPWGVLPGVSTNATVRLEGRSKETWKTGHKAARHVDNQRQLPTSTGAVALVTSWNRIIGR